MDNGTFNSDGASEAKDRLKENQQDDTKKRKKSLVEIFEEEAEPDEDGFSKRIVSVEDLKRKYGEQFTMNNGGSWCRDDGSLGKKYKIVRHKKNNKIVAVELQGFNNNPVQKAIATHIKKAFSSSRCSILQTGKVQIDHKDGTYDSQQIKNLQGQNIADFQPLSQAANAAKRQHCKECLDGTNSTRKSQPRNRFDARRLGYSEGWIKGGPHTDNCVGCYWYDPKKFNETISKDFVPPHGVKSSPTSTSTSTDTHSSTPHTTKDDSATPE